MNALAAASRRGKRILPSRRVTFAAACNDCAVERPVTAGFRATAAALVIACAVLTSCATEEFANASPEVVEDCRREVAILTDPEFATEADPLRGSAMESAPDPIGDAREAREDSGRASLTAWPDEALMYRCLQNRGVPLTADQAELLARWTQDAEGGDR